MKVWIIEDEKALAEALTMQLKGLRPDVAIIGMSSNISDSIAAIRKNPDLDIIFADIKIDDGMSFSVFDAIETSAMVVFTTAYDEYALKAFEYNCVDYLLKPINSVELERALVKCVGRQARINSSSFKSMASDLVHGEVKYRKRLFLDYGGSTMICRVEDLAYVLTEQGYTRVNMMDGSFGSTDMPLRDIMESLDPSLFLRLNRQVILNTNVVDTISPGPGRDYTVTLRPPYKQISFKATSERIKELKMLLNG